MRASVVAAALLISTAAIENAHAASPTWRITKTEWTEADEKGFGEFVRAIAESGCSTTVDCLRDPANPYRDSDPKNLKFIADCADFPYMLRAYYAWKNGLPFGWVNGIAGQAADIRFGGKANRPVSRHDLIDRGAGINGVAALNNLHTTVSTATYRTDAGEQGRVLADFYSPKIAPGSIRPGTAIYDTNGHVVLVYKIDENGRIHYVDADPDHTVSRSMYGPQFGQSPATLGGGFKNFRPVKLVGATQRKDGSYVGGRLVLAKDEEIADFSLEQYRGNDAEADGDGAGALFEYNGHSYGYFEYVRAAMSNGKFTYNPVAELQASMDTICHDLKDRAFYVDVAIKDGINEKPQPARMPGNIYATDDVEWESYSTPSRDARLKNSFALLYQDLSKMFIMWQNGDKRLTYAGTDLKRDLQQLYAQKSATCTVTYTNGAGEPVTLQFEDVVQRLFALSFDPYHCVERRWGATSARELATCRDDPAKARWYKAQQRLRNQAQRSYTVRPAFTLADLEKGATGSGTDDPPVVDIKGLVDNIGNIRFASTMKPVGF
jgi:hypothetical protein